MTKLEFWQNQINELTTTAVAMSNFGEKMAQTAELFESCLQNGGKILLCGNGGSAAEAQHIAAEFTSSLRHEFRRKALPALALTTDTSFMTACSNDFGYETIFARQMEAFGNANDILIALTTSGNSKNVLLGAEEAKRKGMKIIGITGEGGGKLQELCDVIFAIPSRNTQRIQECSLLIQHSLVEMVEDSMFGEQGK